MVFVRAKTTAPDPVPKLVATPRDADVEVVDVSSALYPAGQTREARL